MIQISSPYFVAGVIIGALGTADRAAPIIRYMVGWTADQIIAYCKKRGWHFHAY